MKNQPVMIVILSCHQLMTPYHCNIIISSSYHHSIQSYHHLISLYRRVLWLHLSATSHPRTSRFIPLIFTLVPQIWHWPGPGGHLLSFVPGANLLYQVHRTTAATLRQFLTIFFDIFYNDKLWSGAPYDSGGPPPAVKGPVELRHHASVWGPLPPHIIWSNIRSKLKWFFTKQFHILDKGSH